MIPPKPEGRSRRVSLWRHWRLFRKDILSAQPDHLFSAKMAEFRTPFFRSFLVNEPALIRQILSERPSDFPKSRRVTRGLAPLLGQSVFVTNGAIWERQRRIIDPAFEGGRIRDIFPAMWAASEAAAERLAPGETDIEIWASHATADVIFRTLFSLPIEDAVAARTYAAFRGFQRAQPIATGAALVSWLPLRIPRAARAAAEHLRSLITELVGSRRRAIAAGTAPDDLATRIMTTADPETGETFSAEEMTDQVAIFFLAGHETSASLLGWALWCLAAAPNWQARVAEEACSFVQDPAFGRLSSMSDTRNVLRETLRLYPPVPMMVREASRVETFRNRLVVRGAQIVISPWHMGRHTAHWPEPDTFDPARWDTEGGRQASRQAWHPFSAGRRVCPGAGFAMTEAALMLASVLARFRVEVVDVPVPVAHLTIRSQDGIRLRFHQR